LFRGPLMAMRRRHHVAENSAAIRIQFGHAMSTSP